MVVWRHEVGGRWDGRWGQDGWTCHLDTMPTWRASVKRPNQFLHRFHRLHSERIRKYHFHVEQQKLMSNLFFFSQFQLFADLMVSTKGPPGGSDETDVSTNCSNAWCVHTALMKGNSVFFRYRRFRLVAWRLHLSDAVWWIRSATLPNGNWNEVEHPLRIWLAKTWQRRKHCSGKFYCINMCVRHT